MFSGIVQALGVVRHCEPLGGDLRVEVDARALGSEPIGLGDSVAVNGVCLTAAALVPHGFVADLSAETLACTTLGTLAPGARVNLERALRLADRLDGHLVSGHVDAQVRVLAIEPEARGVRWRFSLPTALARYVAGKGSVALDGVSLTVNGVDRDSFHVMLIPHTLAVTTFGERGVGDAVNLEIDLVARYLARLVDRDGQA